MKICPIQPQRTLEFTSSTHSKFSNFSLFLMIQVIYKIYCSSKLLTKVLAVEFNSWNISSFTIGLPFWREGGLCLSRNEGEGVFLAIGGKVQLGLDKIDLISFSTRSSSSQIKQLLLIGGSWWSWKGLRFVWASVLSLLGWGETKFTKKFCLKSPILTIILWKSNIPIIRIVCPNHMNSQHNIDLFKH